MKGGDVIVLHALQALTAAGMLDRLNVIVVFIGDEEEAGAADVSFVAGTVQAAIDGIGLAGANDHTDQETADLRMLAPLTRRAALRRYRLGTTGLTPEP